jgi:hypothetical protein
MSLELERHASASETGSNAFKAGALQERARCKAIIMSDAAKGRAALALYLATKTDMSIDAALATLIAAAAPAAVGHQPRLVAEPRAQASHAAPGAYGAALTPHELAARVNAENGNGRKGGSAPVGRGGALSPEELARRVNG